MGALVNRWRYIALVAAAFAAGAVGVWAIGGDEEDNEAPPSPSPASEKPAPHPEEVNGGAAPPGGEVEPGGPGAEREVARVVRRYVVAITDRDGEALCELVPSAAELDLPEQRATCAESVSASIGYRDPRGYPVFESARIAGDPEIEVSGDEARATVTVVTDFADRDEPSIEDDVVYLERRGARWVIVKPSATLYRAIGVPDVSPQVLTPR